ncbi:MAG: hypothetical protein Q8910_04240 [Bacteroidota bacterium]|nr:hypothetical protein [Bacteroidota bacterium]
MAKSILTEDFMNQQREYDSISFAIRIAREVGMADEELTVLYNKRQSLNKSRLKREVKVLTHLQKEELNVMSVGEGWYGVRYTVGRKEHVYIRPLNESEVHMLEGDRSNNRPPTREELDQILPSVMNMDTLEKHKHAIHTLANKLLIEYGFIATNDNTKEQSEAEETQLEGYQISGHARKRYAQRVLGIRKEHEADEYAKEHVDEINAAINYQIQFNSELLWVDQEGIQYMFDTGNFVYLIGDNKTIITLYEEDFNWNKEINRSIVYEQIGYITDLLNKANELDQEYTVVVESLDKDINNISNEISTLEITLEKLKTKRDGLNLKKTEYDQNLKYSWALFKQESNKLFKFNG